MSIPIEPQFTETLSDNDVWLIQEDDHFFQLHPAGGKFNIHDNNLRYKIGKTKYDPPECWYFTSNNYAWIFSSRVVRL